MSKDLGTSPAFMGPPYKIWHDREWRQHIHILAHPYLVFMFVAHILSVTHIFCKPAALCAATLSVYVMQTAALSNAELWTATHIA